MFPERRSCLRHKVNGPVFASFDGVTGGMILDLSEQGLSMQTSVPLEADRGPNAAFSSASICPIPIFTLKPPAISHGPTPSVAPASASPNCPPRHAAAWTNGSPSTMKRPAARRPPWHSTGCLAPTRHPHLPRTHLQNAFGQLWKPPPTRQNFRSTFGSSTIQYEFHSLGSDLNTALRVISERARTLLRGSGAAIALVDRGPMMCRASVGNGGPPLGTHVDIGCGVLGRVHTHRKSTAL